KCRAQCNGQKGDGSRNRKKSCPGTCAMLACSHEQCAVKSEGETGQYRAHKRELSIILSHNEKPIRLTRKRYATGGVDDKHDCDRLFRGRGLHRFVRWLVAARRSGRFSL